MQQLRSGCRLTNYIEHNGQYGAGGRKVALTTGVSDAEGFKIVEAYWDLNWAIREVADSLTTKVCGGSMWLWNPVAKLWYSLRHEKDKFSTLCQGTGDYCFDVWVNNVTKRRRQLNATFHDEGVWVIPPERKDDFTQILRDAIDETNDMLKLNVQLGIDIQFGQNYAEIH